MSASQPLGPTELSSLSAYELGVELNKIDHDYPVFKDVAIEALHALASAEAKYIFNPNDLEAKSQIKIQRAVLKASEIQMRTLRLRQSRIQSLLKVSQV